ncbi:hypothetical protein MJI20_31970, partial [Salmonella enterica subsp. enterica serovar Anatum]|nr:hypothetical protein [Salmonella enterica subsp. enterica serovar Anatum]
QLRAFQIQAERQRRTDHHQVEKGQNQAAAHRKVRSFFSVEGQPVVLYKRVILTGDHITDSTSSQDEYNQPQVNISLDSAGGNI